jgi:hypothetical protein
MNKDKQNKDRKIIIRLTNDLANDFINHCDNNGYTMSKRLRLFVEKDIKGELKIK